MNYQNKLNQEIEHNISVLLRVADLINSGIPFSEWPEYDKQVLSMATVYERPTKLKHRKGRLLEEAKAVWLLRYLIFRPHTQPEKVAVFTNIVKSMSSKEKKLLNTTAEMVRADLVKRIKARILKL